MTAPTDEGLPKTSDQRQKEAFWAEWRAHRAWSETPEGKICERALTLASNAGTLGEQENCSQKRWRETVEAASAAANELRALIRSLAASRSPVAAAPPERNQCDGCARDLPVNAHGHHYLKDGHSVMACTAHLYVGGEQPAEATMTPARGGAGHKKQRAPDAQETVTGPDVARGEHETSGGAAAEGQERG